jgi:hypothetical protein
VETLGRSAEGALVHRREEVLELLERHRDIKA